MRIVFDAEIDKAKKKGGMTVPVNGIKASPAWRLLNNLLKRADSAMAAEYDAKFAAVNYGVHPTHYKRFPKASEAWIAMCPNIEERCPVWIATIRRIRSGNYDDWTFAERTNVRAEEFARGLCGSIGNLCNGKHKILTEAVNVIKRRLREKGRSFVISKGDANPVQEALDALSDALNAPRMAGLSTWVSEWCPDHKWNEPKWMDDDKIEKLTDGIYYGEKKFDHVAGAVLCVHLGVERYNAFVKKYNGTVK